MNQIATLPTAPTARVRHNGTIARPSYSFDAFANREDVLREVRLRVAEGRSGREIRQSVLLAWGIHGVGKSWFLRHVEHEFEFQPQVGKNKGTFAALADFARYRPTRAAMPALLEDLVVELGRHVPLDADHRELSGFQGALRRPGVTEAEIADQFIVLISSLKSEYVPVLLFDSLEQIEAQHYELFLWLEEHLFAPLVRWDDTVLVLASRRELRRFRQFEVRRRLKKLPLEAFSPAFTGKQVHSEQVGNLLYPLTYGHPLATWFFQDELNKVRPRDRRFDQSFLEENHTEVVALLGMIEDWLLVDVPTAELRSRLAIAATLRFFHIRSLQLLLTAVEDDDSLLEKSDADFQHLIGDMVDTNLVRWSMEHHGYQVDTTVRHIMNRSLVLRNPEESVRRHECAFRLYADWIEDIPWNSDRFVVEAAFHLGMIASINRDRQSEAESRLNQILDQVFDHSPRDYDLERADTTWQNVHGDDELKDSFPYLFDLLVHRLTSLREGIGNR